MDRLVHSIRERPVSLGRCVRQGLMKMALRREARAEVEHTAAPLDAPLLGDTMEKPSIEANPGRVRGEDVDDPLRCESIGLEVVVPAEDEIVNAPRMGDRGVDALHRGIFRGVLQSSRIDFAATERPRIDLG